MSKKRKNPIFMCNALFSVIDMQPHILFQRFRFLLTISFSWLHMGLDLGLFNIGFWWFDMEKFGP